MTTGRQPTPPPSWRIERHCKHCSWWVAWYVDRAIRNFHTRSGAQAFIDAQRTQGPAP